MDVSVFAFEQQVSPVRQGLFKKGGLLSKPTPPSTEELHAGLDAEWVRIDDFIFPRLSASGVVRYFYGARLRDGVSKLSSVSTSFALAALTAPETVGSPRVFPFPDREDPFVNSQVRQMLREHGEQNDFEIGLLYLSDLAKPEIEQVFKDAYVEFSERARGELHLLTVAANGILNLSLGNLQTGTLGGALAGEASGRISHDTLKTAPVEAFLTMMDIGAGDDGIKGAARSALLRERDARPAVATSEVARAHAPSDSTRESSYSVRLIDSGERKLNVINVVRQITEKSLKEAKDIVESVPVTISGDVPLARAEDIKRLLEESGASVKIIKDGVPIVSKSQEIPEITDDDSLLEFLDAVSDKILQRGLLTKLVGVNDFDIRLSMESYDNKGSQNLKVNLHITCDADLTGMSADRCDEIQDVVIDYLKEKGINDVLIDAGMRSDDPMCEPADLIDWVQIFVNEKQLF